MYNFEREALELLKPVLIWLASLWTPLTLLPRDAAWIIVFSCRLIFSERERTDITALRKNSMSGTAFSRGRASIGLSQIIISPLAQPSTAAAAL